MMQPSEKPPSGSDKNSVVGAGTRLVHPTDLRLSLLIIAACGYFYYLTTQFEQVPELFAQGVTPQFFPRLLLWTIGILALLMPFEHLHLTRRNKDIDSQRRNIVKPIVLATAALLCALVAAIHWVGIWLVMCLTCIALPLLWGERRLTRVLPFAILFPAVVAVLFSKVLKIHLEPGQLWTLLG